MLGDTRQGQLRHGRRTVTQATAEAKTRIGQRLKDTWLLVRLLGVGGASAVYEAVNDRGRKAAVKIMWQQGICKVPTTELAAHEALLASTVAHPGVVRVLDYDFTDDGSSFLVMELLEGETLDQRRRRKGGTLPLDEALPIFEQLLDVLAFAHDRGVVHRDVKPDNVFITRFNQVKVLDFGLAVAGWEQREAGPWFGTPGFMPPEQARAEWSEVDTRSDLWAVAATFYTVLTGRLVHDASTLDGLVRAAQTSEVDPTPLMAAVPTRVVDVLTRALSMDKDDRWPSARSMLLALRTATRRERQSSAPAPMASTGSTPCIPKAPPVPRCHSTTRVFVLRDETDPRLDVTHGKRPCGARAGCGITCVMCPVCPGEPPTHPKRERAIEPITMSAH